MNGLSSVSERLSLDHMYLAMQAFTSMASSFTQLEHVVDLLYVYSACGSGGCMCSLAHPTSFCSISCYIRTLTAAIRVE